MNFIIFLLIQHLFWCFNRQDLMSSGSVIYKPWNSEIVKFWNSVMRTFSSIYVNCFNPVQDGLFWGCSRMGGGGQKCPHSLNSFTHILQLWNLAELYLTKRRSKKYMNHVTHSLSSADISIFSPEISKFCYINKYRYRLYFET